MRGKVPWSSECWGTVRSARKSWLFLCDRAFVLEVCASTTQLHEKLSRPPRYSLIKSTVSAADFTRASTHVVNVLKKVQNQYGPLKQRLELKRRQLHHQFELRLFNDDVRQVRKVESVWKEFPFCVYSITFYRWLIGSKSGEIHFWRKQLKLEEHWWVPGSWRKVILSLKAEPRCVNAVKCDATENRLRL